MKLQETTGSITVPGQSTQVVLKGGLYPWDFNKESVPVGLLPTGHGSVPLKINWPLGHVGEMETKLQDGPQLLYFQVSARGISYYPK